MSLHHHKPRCPRGPSSTVVLTVHFGCASHACLFTRGVRVTSRQEDRAHHCRIMRSRGSFSAGRCLSSSQCYQYSSLHLAGTDIRVGACLFAVSLPAVLSTAISAHSIPLCTAGSSSPPRHYSLDVPYLYLAPLQSSVLLLVSCYCSIPL